MTEKEALQKAAQIADSCNLRSLMTGSERSAERQFADGYNTGAADASTRIAEAIRALHSVRDSDAYRKGFEAARELAAQTSEHWFNVSSAKEQKEAVTRAIRALRPEAESKELGNG